MVIEKLKRAAEDATPGPWEVAVWTCGVRGCEVKRGVDRIGCDLHFPNAAYIAAANPATILALIARVEAAEAELAQEQKRLDWLTAYYKDEARTVNDYYDVCQSDNPRQAIDKLMEDENG